MAQRTEQLASANVKLAQSGTSWARSSKFRRRRGAREINPIGYVFSNRQIRSEELHRRPVPDADAYEKAERRLPILQQASAEGLAPELDLDFPEGRLIPMLMNESKEGVVRVKKIVQDLKDFSRVDSALEAVGRSAQGIDSTLNVVANEIKYKADVVKEYGTLPQVECLPRNSTRCSDPEPARQCRACDGRGARHDHHPHRYGGRQGLAGIFRYRRRHSGRDPARRSSTLLHHQAGRQGHGSGSVAVLRHHPEP